VVCVVNEADHYQTSRFEVMRRIDNHILEEPS
jgi:hypothetical protein